MLNEVTCPACRGFGGPLLSKEDCRLCKGMGSISILKRLGMKKKQKNVQKVVDSKNRIQ